MKKKFVFTEIRIPLFLLLFCLVAYLPLSSFQFGLKNDAFIFNFPNKHFFSESIHAGALPTWNPYLNFGFPLYTDPGFAWWQPVTWIFGLIGYNAYTFTIEILFYIYLSGLGMYWLGRRLNLSKSTGVCLAIMFMCSGFFIGNLQHINFLTCSAFLPWLFGAWILYQRSPNLKNWLGCCVAAYLLCTGGHPAIPIASFLFFIAVTVFYPVFNRQENLKQYLFKQTKLVIGIIIFLLPLLVSYVIVLPYFSRSGPVDQHQNTVTGFTLPSFISFLFPFATIKNSEWFHTDVSMRNGYFSIAGFLLFLIFLIRVNKNYLQRTLLVAGALLLLFSFGGKIKELLYGNLPVFSWIKTNGEFRVFVIFSFIICAGFEIERLLSNEQKAILSFKKLLLPAFVLSMVIISWLFIAGSGRFWATGVTATERMKSFIDNISFQQSLFIAALLTAIFSLCYLLILTRRKKSILFIAVLSAEMILNAWLMLPVTGVGRTSVSEIQQLVSKFPAGFPSPFSISDSLATKDPQEEYIIGNPNWYNKQVIHSRIEYPSLLKSSEQFYASGGSSEIFNKKFAFLKTGAGELRLTKFLPNSFTFQLSMTNDDSLIVQQNYFPGWKATVDGKRIAVGKSAGNFIVIPVTTKDKSVKLEFHAFVFN